MSGTNDGIAPTDRGEASARRTPAAGRAGVLYVTTGSPERPTAEAVRDYLGRFLGDRRLVDLPRWKWMPILKCIILPRRSPKSAERYARIWTDEGSPLVVNTEMQRAALQARLAREGLDVSVVACCLYSEPSVERGVSRLLDDMGVDRIVVLTCYPQYASVTVGSMAQRVLGCLATRKRVPSVDFVDSYCDDEAYLRALAAHVARSWTYVDDGAHRLIFSFHSTLCSDIDAGDVYRAQTEQTSRAVAGLLGIPEHGWELGYQCVFDTHTPWLGPLTQTELLPRLAEQGVTDVAVVAPGFTSECLETYDDVDRDQREAFLRLVPGGRFTYVPCLGCDEAFIDALAGIVRGRL